MAKKSAELTQFGQLCIFDFEGTTEQSVETSIESFSYEDFGDFFLPDLDDFFHLEPDIVKEKNNNSSKNNRKKSTRKNELENQMEMEFLPDDEVVLPRDSSCKGENIMEESEEAVVVRNEEITAESEELNSNSSSEVNQVINLEKNSDETNDNEYDAYLRKDEVIRSLAKEHFEKELSKISLTEMEEALFSKLQIVQTLSVKSNVSSYDFEDIIMQIGKKFVRPILKNAKTKDDFSPLLQMINKRYHVELDFSSQLPLSMVDRNVKSDEKVLKLSISEDFFTDKIEIFGKKNTIQSRSYRNCYYKHSGQEVGDIAYCLSYLIFVSQILNVMDSTDETFDSVKEEMVESAEHFESKMKRILLSNVPFKKDTETDLSDIELILSVEDLGGATNYPFLPKSYYDCMERDGIRVVVMPKCAIDKYVHDKSSGKKKFVCGFESCLFFITLYFRETKELPVHNLWHSSFIKCLNRRMFFSNIWASYTMHYCVYSYLASLFVCVWEEKNRQAKTVSYFRNNQKEHAKSFQTKMNIPVKTVASMKASKLNDYFGFVEFDQTVDLKLMEEVEKEFIATKETYLPFIDSTKNEIRFRLLGNHKASGLYYFGLKCLCVDVRYPYSFIHEYGHLIDFEYGRKSSRPEFRKILSLYEKEIHEAMNCDKDVASKLNGNSKYNLDYYMEPTEVFARSFELYMANVKKVRNSLLPDSFDFAYPKSDEYLNLITEYFDSLFEEIRFIYDSENKTSILEAS